MKSRRGNIPIAILVIGVLIVCTILIGLFYYHSSVLSERFYILGKMEGLIVKENQIEFYEKSGFTKNEALEIVGVKLAETGKLNITEGCSSPKDFCVSYIPKE